MFCKDSYFIISVISFIISDTDSKRRASILDSLNEQYSHLIQNFNISEAYSRIVSNKPYKVLSCFVFDWTFAPLKRGAMDGTVISPKPSSSRGSSKKKTVAKLSKPKEDPLQFTGTQDDEKEFVHPSHR